MSRTRKWLWVTRLAEEVSESCARAEESVAREGDDGGGDDAMFGNRCLRARARAGAIDGGGRCGGWGKRGKRAERQLPVADGPNGCPS